MKIVRTARCEVAFYSNFIRGCAVYSSGAFSIVQLTSCPQYNHLKRDGRTRRHVMRGSGCLYRRTLHIKNNHVQYEFLKFNTTKGPWNDSHESHGVNIAIYLQNLFNRITHLLPTINNHLKRLGTTRPQRMRGSVLNMCYIYYIVLYLLACNYRYA